MFHVEQSNKNNYNLNCFKFSNMEFSINTDGFNGAKVGDIFYYGDRKGDLFQRIKLMVKNIKNEVLYMDIIDKKMYKVVECPFGEVYIPI